MSTHPRIPSPLHPLTNAFQLQLPGELISLTGGGGKTSLLFALSRELATSGRRVIATTTTRVATPELLRAPAHCLVRDLAVQGYGGLEQKLEAHGFCVVVGDVGYNKAKGVPLELPAQLLAHPGIDAVIVEADGAKMLPVKAPERHEPAVPPQSTLVVPLVGIDALSAPIAAIAHRPERLAALLSLSLHEVLTPQHVALLLTSPDGGLRGVPPGARVIPFINKVETAAQMAQALEIARRAVAHSRIQRVFISALQSDRPLRRIVEQPAS